MSKCQQEAKRVRVADDWYPCYDNCEVLVTLTKYEYESSSGCKNAYAQLIACGADDYALEKKFGCRQLGNGTYETYACCGSVELSCGAYATYQLALEQVDKVYKAFKQEYDKLAQDVQPVSKGYFMALGMQHGTM